MTITCNIENNVITLNYAGIGISIDPERVLNSAEELINVIRILPFPEDVKKDMLADTDIWKEYLPVFRKFAESVKYNDCSASLVINEDGTINLHQTEVHTLIDLPKIFSAVVEFDKLKTKHAEDRNARMEERARDWEKNMEKEYSQVDPDNDIKFDIEEGNDYSDILRRAFFEGIITSQFNDDVREELGADELYKGRSLEELKAFANLHGLYNYIEFIPQVTEA